MTTIDEIRADKKKAVLEYEEAKKKLKEWEDENGKRLRELWKEKRKVVKESLII